MNQFEYVYLDLMLEIFKQGKLRPSRVGSTGQIFGATVAIMDLQRGKFPILTTRKMFPAGVWGELAAFLRGATKLEEFQQFGCNYWNDNAAKWGVNRNRHSDEWQVGNIYGAQWRKFGKHGIDQIEVLLEGLTKDPYGRRHLLTTYDPSTLHEACLPPCHLLTQFNVNGSELDAIVYMRSVDVCLGLPADIILYATLLALVAHTVNLQPGRLAFMTGDTHIYATHSESAQLQLEREPLELPGYWLSPEATLDNFEPKHIRLVDYQYHEPIKYELLT